MKKRNFVSSGLLLLIVVLIGIAASYYYFKKDSFQEVGNPNNVVEEKPEEKTESVQSKYLKKITTYEEFQEYANRDESTFFVLGRTGCHFCERYLPVLNSVSNEYKIEIVYVDFKKLSEEDYKKVMNGGLTIPGKCTKTGEEISLSQGFGTPVSLFVRNNQTYDCIRGYNEKDKLVSSLQKIGYIE